MSLLDTAISMYKKGYSTKEIREYLCGEIEDQELARLDLNKLLPKESLPGMNFWEIVDKLNWSNDRDFNKHAKRIYSGEFGNPQVINYQFQLLASNLKRKLNEAQSKYKMSHIPLGDDGYDDLIAHIIGLGQKTYKNTLVKPQIAYDRVIRNDFDEGFQYCFNEPYEPLNDNVIIKGKLNNFIKEISNEFPNQTKVIEGLQQVINSI